MDIPEQTLETLKKVVFNIFDNGKVKDVTMRLAYDSYGEEVVCIQLHVTRENSEAYKGRLIRVPREVRKVLDGELKGMQPVVELRGVR